jgi:hypothetical protein
MKLSSPLLPLMDILSIPACRQAGLSAFGGELRDQTFQKFLSNTRLEIFFSYSGRFPVGKILNMNDFPRSVLTP